MSTEVDWFGLAVGLVLFAIMAWGLIRYPIPTVCLLALAALSTNWSSMEPGHGAIAVVAIVIIHKITA